MSFSPALVSLSPSRALNSAQCSLTRAGQEQAALGKAVSPAGEWRCSQAPSRGLNPSCWGRADQSPWENEENQPKLGDPSGKTITAWPCENKSFPFPAVAVSSSFCFPFPSPAPIPSIVSLLALAPLALIFDSSASPWHLSFPRKSLSFVLTLRTPIHGSTAQPGSHINQDSSCSVPTKLQPQVHGNKLGQYLGLTQLSSEGKCIFHSL